MECATNAHLPSTMTPQLLSAPPVQALLPAVTSTKQESSQSVLALQATLLTHKTRSATRVAPPFSTMILLNSFAWLALPTLTAVDTLTGS